MAKSTSKPRPGGPAPDEVLQRLAVAIDAAWQGAQLTLNFFGDRSLRVSTKKDLTPATEADRGAERRMRQIIRDSFPKDGILGEEFGEVRSRSGCRWILDPLDGTKSFVHGVPLFGTLVGVEAIGRCVIGVCVLPALDEFIYASSGRGAWHSLRGGPEQRARVSAVRDLRKGLFCTTSVRTFDQIGRRDAFERIRRQSGLTRGWGDCYGHVLVATGRAEVMADPVVKIWDCAALQPILEEAGGTFTDWNGTPTVDSGNAISTNGLVLNQVLRVTRPIAAGGES